MNTATLAIVILTKVTLNIIIIYCINENKDNCWGKHNNNHVLDNNDIDIGKDNNTTCADTNNNGNENHDSKVAPMIMLRKSEW